jgi:hypothetical protein
MFSFSASGLSLKALLERIICRPSYERAKNRNRQRWSAWDLEVYDSLTWYSLSVEKGNLLKISARSLSPGSVVSIPLSRTGTNSTDLFSRGSRSEENQVRGGPTDENVEYRIFRATSRRNHHQPGQEKVRRRRCDRLGGPQFIDLPRSSASSSVPNSLLTVMLSSENASNPWGEPPISAAV